MIIYVLRHGDNLAMQWRTANKDALVVPDHLLPDTDVALSDLGEEQGDALGIHFSLLPPELQPTVAFTSPFTRASQTGVRSLAKLPKIVVLQPDVRLREIDFGIFSGLTKKGRAERFPDQWAERRKVGKVHYRPEGGENWHDVADRVLEFRRDRLDPLPLDSVVLLSCHEVVTNVCRWKFEGGDVDALGALGAPSASITSYNFDGKTFALIKAYQLPASPTGRDLFSMESKVE